MTFLKTLEEIRVYITSILRDCTLIGLKFHSVCILIGLNLLKLASNLNLVSDILAKVNSVPNICGIELAFTGEMIPSSIEGYQEFYNSIPKSTDFKEMYAGKVSLSFIEESDTSNAGPFWKQKLVFRFPSSDSQRAERMVQMSKVKFIKIKLTNKKNFVIGRNDWVQNAKPKIKVSSNEKLTQIEFETSSIMPTGYTPYVSKGGLPTFIPINFINEE